MAFLYGCYVCVARHCARDLFLAFHLYAENHFAYALLLTVFGLLSFSIYYSVNQEKSKVLPPLIMITKALHDPVLRENADKPQLVYYDTGGYGEDTWVFGGQGNLFKYLYSDPKIVEIALVKEEVLKSDLPLCEQANGLRAQAFAFEIADFS